MPTRDHIRVDTIEGRQIVGLRNRAVWTNSARVNGKLRLTAHAHEKMFHKNVGIGRLVPDSCQDQFSPSGINPNSYSPLFQSAGTKSQTGFDTAPLWAALEAESYAKFRGKLYKGSAALGVTVGSYKQSREMIVDRYQQLRKPWNHLGDILEKDNRRGRFVGYADRLSGAHLQVIFGMLPLYEDIIAATTTVCQQAAQRDTVRASSRKHGYFDFTKATGPYLSGYHRGKILYSMRVTRAAQVRVQNPNTWLAERAGLLNLAAVAWDLVPWSFVINMFVNTGQLVNSITDFAGLTFENDSTTKSINSTCDVTSYNPYDRTCEVRLPRGNVQVFKATFAANEKTRVLGAVARPPLVLKIPEANWSLAATAASLVTQKISRVSSLIRLSNKYRNSTETH